MKNIQHTDFSKAIEMTPLSPAIYRQPASVHRILNFIGGEFLPPTGGKFIKNYSPADGKIWGEIPDSDAADIELAVAAAERALPEWSKTTLDQRHDLLRAIADGIERNLDLLAEIESRDSGKTITAARTVDIPRAAQNFKFFATAALHFASESHEMPGRGVNYTLRQPVGVVGCISPWNLPLYLFTWKIAPALAAGNCVVAKPSEVTPATAFLLSEICREVGLPAGVLNIVHGQGRPCGEAIVSHPKIKAISFTGSTRAGAEIARVAAPMFKKLSLELGGKNPNLIFADCDFDKMLRTTVQSSFANQGQICLCGSRIYVEKKIYERFKTEFVERVKNLKVGDPSDPSSKLGAVVSELHFQKIMACIELAKQEGGRILCGGHAVKMEGDLAGGWYIAPTVIEGLGNSCRTNQEEIFGPVVTLQTFKTDEEAIALANGVDYGLSATIWTSDLNRAHRAAARVQAGIIWINCWLVRDLRTPFGGVKNSGVGREGGWDALRFFTEPKNVCLEF